MFPRSTANLAVVPLRPQSVASLENVARSVSTMTAEESAEYLNLEVSAFRRAVDRGELPKALIRSRPARWSRVQIDWALEGALPVGTPQNSSDPVMERIHAFQHALRR